MMNKLRVGVLAVGSIFAGSNEVAVAQTNGAESSFYGIVQAMPAGGFAGNWQIGGQAVTATGSTRIREENGAIKVGVCAQVEGVSQSYGPFSASSIKFESMERCSAGTGNPAQPGTPAANEIRFSGSVQKLPAIGVAGDWVVATKTVRVNSATRLRQERGPFASGACVEVVGTSNSDGSIAATEVEARSASAGCVATPQAVKAEAEFFGMAQSIPATGTIGDWRVGGRLVHVAASALIDLRGRPLAVGACVEVKGQMAADGSIDASRVKADDNCAMTNAKSMDASRFNGTVQSLPSAGMVGDWRLNGRTVHVAAGTEFELERGPIGVGACVEVRGAIQPDNSINAVRIENQPASGCNATPGADLRHEFSGQVDTVPAGGGAGDWKIGGRTVHVAQSTALVAERGSVSAGACVEVKGVALPDGSVNASSIETRSASGICIFNGGVVSAASFSGLSIAPGQLVSVFGQNLAPSTDRALEVTDDRVAKNLGNVRVLFDGVPAPLVFVSSGMISAAVPYSVQGKQKVEVQVEHNGAWSNSATVPVAAVAPGIFTATQTGQGQGAILNFEAERNTFSLNAASNRAARGSVIVLYASGEGETNPPGEDGRVNRGANLPKPVQPVGVRIGGREAQLLFAGAAPGILSGVMQVNVRVPDDTPVGSDVPITLIVGDRRSRDSVTVAIK